MTLEYDEHGITLVRPFGGHEGQAYGGGTGRVEGERLSGEVRWSNYPRMTVHDGTIDFTTMSTRFPVYVCIPTDHA